MSDTVNTQADAVVNSEGTDVARAVNARVSPIVISTLFASVGASAESLAELASMEEDGALAAELEQLSAEFMAASTAEADSIGMATREAADMLVSVAGSLRS